jgi:nucleotide-binding universal stress UspA family protein
VTLSGGKIAIPICPARALELGADLMVMGAFGHTRLRDFVLGGATKAILLDVRLPILLSH